MTPKPQDDAETDDGIELMDRRAAIQKGIVGAGVAGAVWAAPKVQGLTFRPDYAAAASAATVPQTLVINVAPPVNPGNLDSGTLLCAGNPAYSVDYVQGGGFFPPADVQLTGIAAAPAAACLTVTSMTLLIPGWPLLGGGAGQGSTTAPDAGVNVPVGQPQILFAQGGGTITIEYECAP